MLKNKKRMITILVLIILLVIPAVIYYINANSASSETLNVTEIKPVQTTVGSLNIMVDPRIELLCSAQLISGYDRMTTFDFDYRKDMLDYFQKEKNHKAVKTFTRLSTRGFSYDAPPTAMLYLTNPPTLKQRTDFDIDTIVRAGNKHALDGFIDNLRDYSIDSKFEEFYNQNLPFYENIVNTISKDVKDMKITEALDEYYAMPVNSYNFILSPMLHSGGYGPRVANGDGLYDIYGIIGPTDTTETINGDIIPKFSIESMSYLAWHEFSHSFVNPTTQTYWNEINQYKDLYTYVSKPMESQAYANWEICVNEHIVRAVTTRLSYLHHGKAAGDQALAYEKGNGFYYIEALCNSLKIYEQQRDLYPTFDSYYPELIKVFKELSEKTNEIKISFTGPINATFSFGADIIFIVPTEEKNSSIEEEIKKYATVIQERFFKDAKIITDTTALERDLGDYSIIAYGTTDGNLWLKEYKDTFPFRIEDNKIIADKQYEDEHLVIISALPNPQNVSNPLLIYTGTQAEDIIDINSVDHGMTDYVIAKKKDVITSGNYEKNNNNWEFLK